MTFVANETRSVKLGSAQSEVDSIAPHPDGSVVAASCDGVLHVLAWPTLAKVAKLKGEGGDLRYSPDGSVLACAGMTDLRLHDSHDGKRRRQLFEGEYSLNQLAFSPDGKRVVVGENERALIFDVASGKQIRAFKVFDRSVRRVCWSPDGRYIATRAWEDAGIFDAATGKRVAVLKKLVGETTSIVFTPDGALWTAIDESAVGIWANGSFAAPAKRIQTESLCRCIAVGGLVIALGDGSTIRLFDERTEAKGSVSAMGEVTSLALSPDGRALFAGVGPQLRAFTSGAAAKPPKIEPPTIEVKVAEPRVAKRDVDISKVPWLSNLGKPLPRDSHVKAVGALAKWPGPDAEGVASYIELLEALEGELDALAALKGITVPKDTYRAVFALAATKVPYDEDADWTEPASGAPYTVATIAGLVERYRLLGWELPETIATLWAWCLDGRWPAGFAKKPGKAAVQLLVL